MRKYLLTILIYLFCSALLLGKNKIVYVDLEYVFKESNLKAESAKATNVQKQQYITLQGNLEINILKAQKELRQLEAMLGHSEYMEILKKRKQKIDLQKKELYNLKKDYEKWYQTAQTGIFEELLVAIETVSQKEGGEIVLSKRPAIVYSKDSLDISDKVIDFLNELNQRESITVK